MEPLVASTLPAVLRPQATAMQSDLAQILKDGRLVAGEVLPGPSDGNVLLALGRHRVPAQTDVRFEPGRSFLFRVEEADGGVILCCNDWLHHDTYGNLNDSTIAEVWNRPDRLRMVETGRECGEYPIGP